MTRPPARSLGKVHAIDQVAGSVDLKRGNGERGAPPRGARPARVHPARMTRRRRLHAPRAPGSPTTASMRTGPWRAARDLLLRHAPRVGQAAGRAAARSTARPTWRRRGGWRSQLDHSVLAIQGPPGAGKTFTGARMIVELVRAGKRVGVTANSHKVIGNLLDDGREAAAESRRADSHRPEARARTTSRPAQRPRPYDNDARLAAALDDRRGRRRRRHGLAVGQRRRWPDSVDVLFVDEAGQMSLANVLAVVAGRGSRWCCWATRSSSSSPSKGSHPPGAEASALAAPAGSTIQTMPPELGLFLERTWRLHPDICAFTSEVFYDGRLESEPTPARSRSSTGAARCPGRACAGRRSRTKANVNSSPEEVEVVARDLRRAAAVATVGRTTRASRGPSTGTTSWSSRRTTPRSPPSRRVCGQPDSRRHRRQVPGPRGAVAIYSMATSSADLAPRGMDFLYSLNRLNVATSRARCLSIVVGSPALLDVVAHSPTQMRLANALCRLVEVAEGG